MHHKPRKSSPVNPQARQELEMTR